MRTLREDNVRSSDDIIEIYEEFIRDGTNDLGDEKWMVLEQVIIAAFDTHREDIAEDCLKELSTMFDPSSSLRMLRLRAMQAEMHEQYDLALDLLDWFLFILLQHNRKTIQQTKKISSLMVQNQFFYQVLFVHEVAMNLNILGLTMIQNKLMIFDFVG